MASFYFVGISSNMAVVWSRVMVRLLDIFFIASGTVFGIRIMAWTCLRNRARYAAYLYARIRTFASASAASESVA